MNISVSVLKRFAFQIDSKARLGNRPKRSALLFAGAFILACLLQPLLPARAAVPLDEGPILVLPFSVTGSPDNAALENELPRLVAQRLLAKGLTIMPHEETLALLRAAKPGNINGAAARSLLAGSRAGAAIYGSCVQNSSGITLDVRLVRANKAESPRVLRAWQKDPGNLLFAVEDLAGQVNSEMRKNYVISRIEVRGTKVLNPDVVLLRLNTRQGDPIDAQALDRELKRIWELGYFSDISLDLEQSPAGIALVYNVTEKPRVSSVTFENVSAVDLEDLRTAMSTHTGSVLNDKTLVADLQAINELYRKNGHYLAKVSYRLEEDRAGNTAALIVHVEEGQRLFIKKINLEGVDSFSQGTVKDELALAERWLFSFLTGSGILQEELLERDVSAIIAFYMNNGFMDIQVPSPRVDYKEDGIYITFTVSEGPRYRVNGVGFAGELIDSDETLAALTRMHTAARKRDYFSLSMMQDDIKALSAYYAEYGYAFADVSPRPRKSEDPADPGVFVVYAIEKQQKVYVRNIIIEGNIRTRDNVILREMQLADGDAFNGRLLSNSMRRLNNLGFFEQAESELVPTANPEEADLKIKLKERNTGALMGGVGYSTYSKFGVTGSIQESNLWGKGYGAAFQVMFSGLHNSYDLSFLNPRVNDSKFSLYTNAYRWEDDYTDYQRDTMGGNVRVGHPLGEYTGISLGYNLEIYKLYDFDSAVSQVLRRYEGKRSASSALLHIERNTTERMRLTDSTVVSFSAQYTGNVLGGDDAFIRLMANLQFYKMITSNSAAHLRLRGGAILENGNKSDNPIPIFERFWMGGIDTVRGYYSRDIVPRDLTLPSHDRIGGTRMAYANVEYIISLSQELGLNIVPFFDIGLNVDHKQDFSWHDDNKKSAGLELRWRSPMGDLRFSWGYPFDKGWGGQKLSSRFEFSIGNFF